MSEKAKSELAVLREVKKQRMKLLNLRYGYIPCEYCLKPINPNSLYHHAEAHHNNHDRRDNRLENIRITGRMCNQKIEDLNVKNVPSMLEEI